MNYLKTMCFLMVALFVSEADADSDTSWRTADSVREGAYQLTNLLDMGTTIDVAHHDKPEQIILPGPGHIQTPPPEQRAYREDNPEIGHHPTVNRVVAIMSLNGAVHAGISYLLPHGWRDAWQYWTIWASSRALTHNLNIGLSVRF